MLTEMFERVAVINLERRQERMKSFFERLPEDWPFRYPVRYEAVDGEISPPPKWWNGGNGAWGCYRTHLNILEECLNRGVDSVLILEDDAVCVQGFGEKVQLFVKSLPEDWGMIYFGGQHIHENLRLPRKINEWVYSPFNVNRTHCYGIRGHSMLERVYRHLHDPTSWHVAHHVDHYLGELHKNIQQGLYVPREWLVAQAEGASDIDGKMQNYRLYPGSEEVVFPTVSVPCVAVTGYYGSGINILSGLLSELGIGRGRYSGPDLMPAKNLREYGNPLLNEICTNCYHEPWLENILEYEDRTNHLRRWAGIQCQGQKELPNTICGTHPILSLMTPEIQESWHTPKYIMVERSENECVEAMRKTGMNWHPQAINYSFGQIHCAMAFWSSKLSPEQVLRLTYFQIKEQSDYTVTRICRFLNYQPTSEQYARALSLVQRSQSDDDSIIPE